MSETHRKILADIEFELYDAPTAGQLFEYMSERGDRVCEMHLGLRRFNRATARDFARGLNLKKKKKEKWYDNVIPALIAGCFNFFRMNDRQVDRTFDIVAQLYPGQKDCFSVGFMQPYMLHSRVGCMTLTMLDADWRILHAHLELLERFKLDQLRPHENALPPDALQGLPVAWLARFDRKPKKREKNITLKTFCVGDDSSYCEADLLRFQNEYRGLQQIELQLAFLHEARVAPLKSSTAIVFVSNALDKHYTTKAEFKKMLDSLSAGISPEQKVVIVYQAGGGSLFGIYELTKENDKPKVATICRDRYVWAREYHHRGKPFSIHFDRVTTTSGAPYCSG